MRQTHPHDNPLTLTARAIWSALEADEELCALVPTPNRIGRDIMQPHPEQAALAPADFPRMSVEWIALSEHARTSNGVLTEMEFQVVVLTADLSPYEVMRIAWAVLRALYANLDTLLSSTQYLERGYQWQLTIGDAQAFDTAKPRAAAMKLDGPVPAGCGIMVPVAVAVHWTYETLGTEQLPP